MKRPLNRSRFGILPVTPEIHSFHIRTLQRCLLGGVFYADQRHQCVPRETNCQKQKD